MTSPSSRAGLAVAEPARRLDLRGEVCPAPTDETMRALDELMPGDVLEVECDYYPAKATIPFLCEKRGYSYAFVDEGEAAWRLRIRKP